MALGGFFASLRESVFEGFGALFLDCARVELLCFWSFFFLGSKWMALLVVVFLLCSFGRV